MEAMQREIDQLRHQLQQKDLLINFLNAQIYRQMAEIQHNHDLLVQMGILPTDYPKGPVVYPTGQIEQLPADIQNAVLDQQEGDCQSALKTIQTKREELKKPQPTHMPAPAENDAAPVAAQSKKTAAPKESVEEKEKTAEPTPVMIVDTKPMTIVNQSVLSNISLSEYLRNLYKSNERNFPSKRFKIDKKTFFTAHRATIHKHKNFPPEPKDINCFAELTQFETQVVAVSNTYIRVYTGGWQTRATERVVNFVLEKLGVPERIFMKRRGEWYVVTPQPFYTQVPFEEGICIPRDL